MVRHAVFELDGEVTQGAGPVGDGQGPLAADVFQAQVEQLEQRVHRGEQVSVAADLAKRAVERFDRVGGVDDPSDLWGEVEERRELVPMRLPTPADGWVPGVMGGAEGFQRGACGLLGGGAVDGLEVEAEFQCGTDEIEELTTPKHGDHVLDRVADLGPCFGGEGCKFLGKCDRLFDERADGVIDRRAEREEHLVDRVLEGGEQSVSRLALRLHHARELAAL